MNKELFDHGRAMRRAVAGDGSVDAALERAEKSSLPLARQAFNKMGV